MVVIVQIGDDTFSVRAMFHLNSVQNIVLILHFLHSHTHKLYTLIGSIHEFWLSHFVLNEGRLTELKKYGVLAGPVNLGAWVYDAQIVVLDLNCFSMLGNALEV